MRHDAFLASLRFLVGVWVLIGCTARNPEWCDATHPCTDGRSCDIDGLLGLRNQCITAGLLDGPPGDAAPADAAVPCSDAGLCPDELPICRPMGCGRCSGALDCPIAAPRCTTAGRCQSCMTPADCAPRAQTPYCGGSGACVECQRGTDCPTDRPVCDSEGSCRVCRADSDCSELCDLDSGRCVAEADIRYVDSAANGTSCTKAAPCPTIGAALGRAAPTTRSWLKIAPGVYDEAVQIAALAITLVGPGATVLPPSGQAGLLVRGSAEVQVRGLRIVGAAGGTDADGIRCDGDGAGKTKLRLAQVTIEDNAGQGIEAERCTIAIDRSTLQKNGLEGALFSESDFDLRSSFIVQNGQGITIKGDPPGGAAAARIRFVTIAKNGDVGVACIGGSAMLAFSDDIVHGNGPAQLFGNRCSFSYSAIGPMPSSGTGNISDNPMFVGSGFHLAPNSPCVNAGDPAASTGIDFDGEIRPARGRADIGADEVP